MFCIKNIRIVDDSQDFFGYILVDEGKIIEIGEQYNGTTESIDFLGDSKVLLPAFTDLHAHFRDPGFTYKEDLQTGCLAALHGGYTAVNLMPNTRPVCSTLELVKAVEDRSKLLNMITVNQTLSMTQNLEGKDYSHLLSLQNEEVLFVTDDGKGVNDDEVMEAIMKICKEKNIVIMQHAEDSRYSATDMREAENSMTFRDLRLFQKIGGHLHFCHVSTIEAIEAIEKAQIEGRQVTCEVTPHHLFATGKSADYYRVNPPLRDEKDIDALIQAIKNKHVIAIATDHAPHSKDDKNHGSPGMIGLELAFSLCYTKLVRENHISLQQLIALMSTQPSEMMKLNKGKIKLGMDADFVIADLENPYYITPEYFYSKSKNTPFIGQTVYGKILNTIRLGKIYTW